MIIKEINAKSVKGILEYIDKEKAKEIQRTGISSKAQFKDIVEAFKFSTINADSRVVNKYKHFIISFHPDDAHRIGYNDDLKKQILNEFLTLNGYSNQTNIIFEHSDTHALHYHIVASAIDPNTNKKIYTNTNSKRTKYQIQDIREELNLKYKLSKPTGIAKTSGFSYKNEILYALDQCKDYKYTNDRQLNKLLQSHNDKLKLQRVSNSQSSNYGYVYQTSSGKIIKSSTFHHTADYKSLMSKFSKHKKEYNRHIKSDSFKRNIKPRINNDIKNAIKNADNFDDLKYTLSQRYSIIAHESSTGDIIGHDIIDHTSKYVYKSTDINRSLNKDLLHLHHNNNSSVIDENIHLDQKIEQSNITEKEHIDKDLSSNESKYQINQNNILEEIINFDSGSSYSEDIDDPNKFKKKRKPKKRRK